MRTLMRCTHLSIFLALIAISSSSHCDTPMAGKVVLLSGSVTLAGKPLTIGKVLSAGDVVETKAGATAKILLSDRSVVDIGPSSRFELTQVTPSEGADLKLEWGSVRASIQKKIEKGAKFRIRTKSSVLSARGTEFVVNSRPDAKSGGNLDQITVSSGLVTMDAPGFQTLTLDPGKQVTALAVPSADGFRVNPDSVRTVALSPEVLSSTVSTATVKDDTFRQVVVVQESPSRSPSSTGGPGIPVPPPAGGFQAGQEAIATATGVAAKEPEANRPVPPPPALDGRLRPPPDQSTVGNLNKVAGGGAEKKLVGGVNVTVVFRP